MMIPWIAEPDMWIDVKDFCRLFNYSYKGHAVYRRLIKTGALADFGIQVCCVVIRGKANFRQSIRWYIKLKD